jgi:hypothetical protein
MCDLNNQKKTYKIIEKMDNFYFTIKQTEIDETDINDLIDIDFKPKITIRDNYLIYRTSELAISNLNKFTVVTIIPAIIIGLFG